MLWSFGRYRLNVSDIFWTYGDTHTHTSLKRAAPPHFCDSPTWVSIFSRFGISYSPCALFRHPYPRPTVCFAQRTRKPYHGISIHQYLKRHSIHDVLTITSLAGCYHVMDLTPPISVGSMLDDKLSELLGVRSVKTLNSWTAPLMAPISHISKMI